MIESNLIRCEEPGEEALLLRYREACNGYACLDNGSVPLAMSYTPMQRYENVYTPAEGWAAGTLFRDLDKPFLGAKGVVRV